MSDVPFANLANANAALYQQATRPGSQRAAPADDLVRAVERLNEALDVARCDGWTVDLAIEEPPAQSLGRRLYGGEDAKEPPRLAATITRKV